MQTKGAIRGFALITLVYVAALVWLDSRQQVFAGLPALWTALPAMLAASLLSYFIRFLRWHQLLVKSGYRVRFGTSLSAYVAGFAFTATPGKIGELVRIRYLQDAGVPPGRTLAAFIFERALDLVAVLALASLAIRRGDIFAIAAIFVVFMLGAVWIAASHPDRLTRLAARLRVQRARRPAKVVRILRDGLTGCRSWARPEIVAQAFLMGLLAWVATSWSFVHLLGTLHPGIPALEALSIYPLSMLAGAASMLPGGLGSTEATTVALVTSHGVDVERAVLAAIGIRLTSFWFSILLGLTCVTALEWTKQRDTKRALSLGHERPDLPPDSSGQAGPNRSHATE